MPSLGTLHELYRYPFSGGQAESLDEATVLLTGLEGDRQYVAYSPDKYAKEPYFDEPTWHPGVHERISQRQQPSLARVRSQYGEKGAITLSHEDDAGETHALFVPSDIGRMNRGIADVFEFGDHTEAIDVGREAEDYLRLVTGMSAKEGIRLARKTRRWMNTTDQNEIFKRNVRPLHIVSAAAIASLQAEAASRGMLAFGAERFRPNFVIDTLGVQDENELIGGLLVVGSLLVRVTDVTRRCPVPGFDQRTGENRKDVPTLYPTLHRATAKPEKPIFGVYGVPLRQGHNTKSTVEVGDEVYSGSKLK